MTEPESYACAGLAERGFVDERNPLVLTGVVHG